MLSSPSAITEVKSSCLSGFLCYPSLSFSTIRPFIWGVLFRQYHGSEEGLWNCLHKHARVGWSPGKCQISLVFSDLFTDFTRSWPEQWEEDGAPYVHPAQRAGVADPVQNGPMACCGTPGSGSHRGPWLAVPCGTPPSTAFHRAPAASWPILHTPAPSAIWEGKQRTASWEQSFSQGRSSLLPSS